MKGSSVLGIFRWSTALAAVLALLAGCAADGRRADPAPPAAVGEAPISAGYACCNLRYSGDTIGDANLAQQAFIPAGTPIRVRRIDGHRAEIEVDGKAMRLVHDYGRDQESLALWLNRIVVGEDPRPRIARYPAALRKAIAAGQLAKGMSREQAIVAIGYPPAEETGRSEATYWRYWWSNAVPFYVHWTKSGSVGKIEGDAETVARLLYR